MIKFYKTKTTFTNFRQLRPLNYLPSPGGHRGDGTPGVVPVNYLPSSGGHRGDGTPGVVPVNNQGGQQTG